MPISGVPDFETNILDIIDRLPERPHQQFYTTVLGELHRIATNIEQYLSQPQFICFNVFRQDRLPGSLRT